MKKLIRLVEEMTPAEAQAKKSAIAAAQERIKDATNKIRTAKSPLEKKAAQDALVAAKEDDLEAKAIQETASEEADRKYTTQESIAIGKAVVRPLIAALKSVGSEFKEDSKAKVNSKRANSFEIRVTYAKDTGEGVFEFEINPNGAKNELSIKTPDNKFEIVADDVTVPTGGTGRAAIGAEQQLIDKLVDSTAIQKFTSEPSNVDNMPEGETRRQASMMEKKLTKPELRKREEIVKAMKKEGEPKNARTYAIATAQAKKLAEDLDLGHQDDEPGMLLGDLYSIMKSTKELYEMVSQFEGQGEVDFPHWWQAKIIKAKSCLQAANQYLDFEVNKPQQVKKVQVVALQEKKGTCCHKCGHVHVKGTSHPTPYLTGQKNCKYRD